MTYLLTNWPELLGLLFSTLAKIGVGNKWKYTPLVMSVGSVIWFIFGITSEHYAIALYHLVMTVYSLYSQLSWSRESSFSKV